MSYSVPVKDRNYKNKFCDLTDDDPVIVLRFLTEDGGIAWLSQCSMFFTVILPSFRLLFRRFSFCRRSGGKIPTGHVVSFRRPDRFHKATYRSRDSDTPLRPPWHPLSAKPCEWCDGSNTKTFADRFGLDIRMSYIETVHTTHGSVS